MNKRGSLLHMKYRKPFPNLAAIKKYKFKIVIAE